MHVHINIPVACLRACVEPFLSLSLTQLAKFSHPRIEEFACNLSVLLLRVAAPTQQCCVYRHCYRRGFSFVCSCFSALCSPFAVRRLPVRAVRYSYRRALARLQFSMVPQRQSKSNGCRVWVFVCVACCLCIFSLALVNVQANANHQYKSTRIANVMRIL